MNALASYMGPYQDIIHLHRPISQRITMAVSHRAKQFAPFSALKGFEDCIRKKEEIYVPYLELSEETKEDIDHKLRMMNYHDKICVTYFQENPESMLHVGQYKKITGTVEYIDSLHRYVRVDDTEVFIDSITNLEYV